ncbi:hypothetical protein FHR84_002920 [Actinopolyspora biskrensis]|uniref:Uncharacterized protein n=1 Tax=Actinopolyspora biskrensis TaxID=1470178 RepID=A0A852Z0R5_9ACTN|nr:hypothetical protein [Actinopolyspora biskrensis]NYH79582.1 hypothetical protein [Actinopolyspora biskrensis]
METPQRDLGRPGAIRSAPPECTHPRERLRWVGDFSGEPDHWVFRVDCLRCGGSWDHTSEDDNAPWDQVTRMLEEGRFSRLYPGLGPARGATRATAAVAERTTEIMRDLESMGDTKFPID